MQQGWYQNSNYTMCLYPHGNDLPRIIQKLSN